MKKRLTRVLNFFAFNLLFFALYLNFIHKDNDPTQTISRKSPAATVQGTVLVSNPEQYINKDHVKPAVQTAQTEAGSAPKLSYN